MLDENIRRSIMQVRDQAVSKKINALFMMHREKSHLMRIGNNSVSLNTSVDLTRLDVKVIDRNREGSYTVMGNLENPALVENALQTAVDKASVSSPKTYKPLERIIEKSAQENFQYDAELENMDPGIKAEVYRDIIKKIGDQYNYSGSWSSGSTEIFLTCTASDNQAWRIGTDQQFSCVLKDTNDKWELASYQTGWKFGDVTTDNSLTDFQRLLPVYEKPGFKVSPGEYTVIFGSQALADIIMMMLWTGFEGRKYEEKIGWTSGKNIGDLILSEKVTVVDDPSNMGTFRFGFDTNGMIRSLFPLISAGKMTNIMYDFDTAAKYDKKPTPHEISASIVMEPGSGPACPLEAAQSMGQVLYIPALHYVNIPNQSKGIFTGSSRFNAVLLDNGKMLSPIFSSRVTDTFQNVLSNVELLSSESVSVNCSHTYARRMPEAFCVPSYMICTGIKITDCADSF